MPFVSVDEGMFYPTDGHALTKNSLYQTSVNLLYKSLELLNKIAFSLMFSLFSINITYTDSPR